MSASDSEPAQPSPPSSSSGNSGGPAFVRALQRVDDVIGKLEQGALVVFLTALIAVGAYQAVGRNFFDHSPLWTYDAIRYSVFFIAMSGAALAAQTRQLIRMDVVTRALSPRGRAIARMATGVFSIAMCLVFAYSGLTLRGVLVGEQGSHLLSAGTVVLAIPIGAGLIAFHLLVQMISFASALARGDEIEDEAQAMH